MSPLPTQTAHPHHDTSTGITRRVFSVRVLALAIVAGMYGLSPTGGWAASTDDNVNPDFVLCPPFGPDRPPLPIQPIDTPTQATADHIRLAQDGTINMTGEAMIQRPTDRVTGDELTYRKKPDEKITGSGNLWYETPDFIIQAKRGWLLPQMHQGQLSDTRYWLATRQATGTAAQVEQQSASTYQLNSADYSTCPPDHRSWDIAARRITLDRESGKGVARDAVLHAGGVPVFYFPYWTFSLDKQRQSGFLLPSFGSSTTGGLEYAQPIYWNIAPNMDATVGPHLFTRRGLGLDTEFRYLHTFGESGLGRDQVNVFWLPHDRVYGDRRWSLALKDQAQIAPNLNYSLTVNRVSDNQFFRDFSTNLTQSVTDNLASQFTLNTQAGGWGLGLLALRYQTINPLIPESAFPYRIMPRLTATRGWDFGPASLSLNADVTRFSHPDSGNTVGERLHVAPSLYHVYRSSWYEVTPRLTLDATTYQLTRGVNDPLYGSTDPQTHPNRVLPITSVDAKLYFERAYGRTGRYRAELQPRLYYLNVPYRDQNAIPLFDTGLTDLSYSQLFTANRFSGGDRISDANALTYGMSWSLIDVQEGTEPLSLRVAQRYNFRESRVTPMAAQGGTTVVAEAYSDITRNWNGAFTAEYDTDSGHIGRTQTRLGYRTDHGSVANLSYFTKPQDYTAPYRQTDISFAWQASPHWQILGRLGYDFTQKKIVQSLLGVGYDSCCWATRIALKRYVVSPQTITATANPVNYSNAIIFEVELKGLGAFGKRRGLQREILGYDP